MEFIINHSDSGVVFVSTEKLPQLVKALDKVTQVMKVVVVWGAGNESAEQVGALVIGSLGWVVWKRFRGCAVLISRGVTKQAMWVAFCLLACLIFERWSD